MLPTLPFLGSKIIQVPQVRCLWQSSNFKRRKMELDNPKLKQLSLADLIALRNYSVEQSRLNETYWLQVRYQCAHEIQKRLTNIIQ